MRDTEKENSGMFFCVIYVYVLYLLLSFHFTVGCALTSVLSIVNCHLITPSCTHVYPSLSARPTVDLLR